MLGMFTLFSVNILSLCFVPICPWCFSVAVDSSLLIYQVTKEKSGVSCYCLRTGPQTGMHLFPNISIWKFKAQFSIK